MELAGDLGAWTLERIRSLAATTDYEPAWFDFKEILGGPIADRIRTVACAMANTAGGYLIFGVKDRANRREGEDPVVGLDLTKSPDLRKHFGDLVQLIRQPIQFDCSPKAIPVDGAGARGVFVARVSLSPLRPHELEGRFWQRGDGGSCVPMQFYQVRDQMLLSEDRRKKVDLLRLQLRQLVAASQEMSNGTKGNSNLAFDRFDTSSMKALIADKCSILPGGQDLVTKLLAIDQRARRANVTLQVLNEHWLEYNPSDTSPLSTGTFSERRRADLFEAAEKDRQEVVRVCKECEEVLRAHFGALPS